jgi:hypothetical protein
VTSERQAAGGVETLLLERYGKDIQRALCLERRVGATLPQQIFAQARDTPLQLPHRGAGLRLADVPEFERGDAADVLPDQNRKSENGEDTGGMALCDQFRRRSIIAHDAAPLCCGKFDDVDE